jgi:hypothetical protein
MSERFKSQEVKSGSEKRSKRHLSDIGKVVVAVVSLLAVIGAYSAGKEISNYTNEAKKMSATVDDSIKGPDLKSDVFIGNIADYMPAPAINVDNMKITQYDEKFRPLEYTSKDGNMTIEQYYLDNKQQVEIGKTEVRDYLEDGSVGDGTTTKLATLEKSLRTDKITTYFVETDPNNKSWFGLPKNEAKEVFPNLKPDKYGDTIWVSDDDVSIYDQSDNYYVPNDITHN